MPPRSAAGASSDGAEPLYQHLAPKLGQAEAWSLLKDTCTASGAYRLACSAWDDETLREATNKDTKLRMTYGKIIPRSIGKLSVAAAQRKVGDTPAPTEAVVQGDDFDFYDEPTLAAVGNAISAARGIYVDKLTTYAKTKDKGGWEGRLTSSVAYGLACQASAISRAITRNYNAWETSKRELSKHDLNDTLFTFSNGRLGDPAAFALRNAQRRMYALAGHTVASTTLRMTEDQINLTEAGIPLLAPQQIKFAEEDLSRLRDNKANKALILEQAGAAQQLVDDIHGAMCGVKQSDLDKLTNMVWKVWDLPSDVKSVEFQELFAQLGAPEVAAVEDGSWMNGPTLTVTSSGSKGKNSKKSKKKKGKQGKGSVNRPVASEAPDEDVPEEDTRSTSQILSNAYAGLSTEGREALEERRQEEELMKKLEALSKAQSVKSSVERTAHWTEVLSLARHNSTQKKERLARKADAARRVAEQTNADSQISKPSNQKSGTLQPGPATEDQWKTLRRKMWLLSHPEEDPNSYKDEPPVEFAEILQEEILKRKEEERIANRGILSIPPSLLGTVATRRYPPSSRSLLDYLKTDADKEKYLAVHGRSTTQDSKRRRELARPSWRLRASEKKFITRPDINTDYTPLSLNGALWFAPETLGEAELNRAIAEGMERLSESQMEDFTSWAKSVPEDKRTPLMLWSIYKRFVVPPTANLSHTNEDQPSRIPIAKSSAIGTHRSTLAPVLEDDTDVLIEEDTSDNVNNPAEDADYVHKRRRHSLDESLSPDFEAWNQERRSALYQIQVPDDGGIVKHVGRPRAFSNPADCERAIVAILKASTIETVNDEA